MAAALTAAPLFGMPEVVVIEASAIAVAVEAGREIWPESEGVREVCDEPERLIVELAKAREVREPERLERPVSDRTARPFR